MTVMFTEFTLSKSLTQQPPTITASQVCPPWCISRTSCQMSTKVRLWLFINSYWRYSISGEILDGEESLKWMMTHLESAEIEEVSNSMLGRLIRDTRNIVVIFCKYIAYAIIALTHTCYLIKNYAPDDIKKYLPPQTVRGMASETWQFILWKTL